MALRLMVMCLLVAASLNAQDKSQVVWRGVLHDAAGAPIASARIELKGTKQSAHETTGKDGGFEFHAMPVGQYRLFVDAKGKMMQSAQVVDLAASTQAVVITVSERGEITVVAMQGASEAATGGEQLTGQAVSSLPLNKRDFSSLLLLAAGTMTDANGATNFTAQLPSTASAAWRRRLPWTARTSAIRRWAALRSRTSTWMRSRRFSRVRDGCRRRLGAARLVTPTS